VAPSVTHLNEDEIESLSPLSSLPAADSAPLLTATSQFSPPARMAHQVQKPEEGAAEPGMTRDVCVRTLRLPLHPRYLHSVPPNTLGAPSSYLVVQPSIFIRSGQAYDSLLRFPMLTEHQTCLSHRLRHSALVASRDIRIYFIDPRPLAPSTFGASTSLMTMFLGREFRKCAIKNMEHSEAWTTFLRKDI
jgi:hypothetical protein